MSDKSVIFRALDIIGIIDQLRDSKLSDIIELPRIVACGGQSSGKSSVLESIVGLDFLPRNEGLCTRRPLELRLKHIFKGDSLDKNEGKPWAQFESDTKRGPLCDFNEVREEIIRLTDEVAGTNKGIVDKPMILSIYSPDVLNLTIIDLPGITRNPLKDSDQKDDIEAQTRGFTKTYISEPRTIILAVSPANNDLSNSDALKAAREVDPNGDRTVGVLTKLDIADKGTNIHPLLSGRDFPLKLGYYAVKNRCQEDIVRNVKVQDALLSEEEWFAKQDFYSSFQSQLGSEKLANRLVGLLNECILKTLPTIRHEIESKKLQRQLELAKLGSELLPQPAERLRFVGKAIIDFCKFYEDVVRGRLENLSKEYGITPEAVLIENAHPPGNYIIQKFQQFLVQERDKKLLQEIQSTVVQHNIHLFRGVDMPGFFQTLELAFSKLLRPYFEELLLPSLDLVRMTKQVLEGVMNQIGLPIFGRFQGLHNLAMSIALKCLSDAAKTTEVYITQLLDTKSSAFYTDDSEYVKKHATAQNVFLDDKVIHERIDNYYTLVVSGVRDDVPRGIRAFLINGVFRRLQEELTACLCAPESQVDYSELLQERSEISTQRVALKSELQVLENAEQLLQRKQCGATDVSNNSNNNNSNNSGSSDPQISSKSKMKSKNHSGLPSNNASSSGSNCSSQGATPPTSCPPSPPPAKPNLA